MEDFGKSRLQEGVLIFAKFSEPKCRFGTFTCYLKYRMVIGGNNYGLKSVKSKKVEQFLVIPFKALFSGILFSMA
jgi:hypothetical protein